MRIHTPRELKHEADTLAAMLSLFCRDSHGTHGELCPNCRDLLDYAMARTTACRFGAEKPRCSDCPVHCYAKSKRAAIRNVMRYAGPRLMLKHPLMVARHIVQGLRYRPRRGKPRPEAH